MTRASKQRWLRCSITFLSIFGALILGAVWLQAQENWRVTKSGGTRFVAVDVFVDSGAQPLAAYQLTFLAGRGKVRIVGIEGGEHAAFKEPPYYDPRAIQNDRAVLAAFNTAASEKLPRGRTRVATLHLQVSGAQEIQCKVNLATAASCDGRPISVECSAQERNAQ